MENKEELTFYVIRHCSTHEAVKNSEGNVKLFLFDQASKELDDYSLCDINESRYFSKCFTLTIGEDYSLDNLMQIAYQYHLSYDFRRKVFITQVMDNDCSKVCKFLNKMLKEQNE